MAKKSAAASFRVKASDETLLGLRRFNGVMGVLHLVQGILMIALSNDTTYPIYTNYLQFDLSASTLRPNPELLYEFRAGRGRLSPDLSHRPFLPLHDRLQVVRPTLEARDESGAIL
jgi:hypothetical protein